MSAVRPVDAALAAIAERPELGAFWAVAEQAEPRAGMPIAVKDSFDVAGLPTTGGVPGPAPPARIDAELVRRLRAVGAVPVGKTAMDQLGWSMGGRAPGRPPCVNPLDARRSPGGSSAGSAVAVAAALVPLAIGTDTAGSVRVPAAFCGVVGFKPARGALPRRGLAQVVPALETPGFLARTVADCRRAYEAITGRTVPAAGAAITVGRLDDLLEGADADVAGPVTEALRALPDRHRIAGARLGWAPRGLGRLLAAELHRTWGARIRAEPERFTSDVRDSAARGAALSEAAVTEVLTGLRRSRRAVPRRLEAFDVLASPTVPHGVPLAGAESVDTCSRFTRPFNALGWPAISVPCGTDANGLPVGLQLAAPPGRLPALLATAAAVEAMMDSPT